MDHEGHVGEAPASPASTRWLVAALTAALALPLVVGLAALRRPTWSPVLDFSMTEFRLRDVGGSHTPLVGLPGRIGDLAATQGSHPGPLSFYVLAPVYRLFGSTAWAMQVAAVASNVAAAGVAVWLAARRGGRRLALVAGLLLGLLTAGYGISPLTEPWNPYLPMLWWFVVLLAVWSVLAGDPVAFPVAVVAGSFCAQTHLPYLGLAGGLVVLLAAGQIAGWVRARQATEPHPGSRWLVAGLALGVVLWVPPVLEQLSPPPGEPGNAELIVDTILTPEEDPVGPGEAVEVALGHLDPVPFLLPGDGGIDGGDGALLEASFDGGNALRGGLVLLIWLAAAAWSFAHRGDGPAARSRWWLHVVVAAALALGLFNISRIYGKVWYYLTLWAWGTTAVLLLAVGVTMAAVAGRRAPGSSVPLERWGRRGEVAAVAATGVVLAWFTVDAADAPTPDATLSEVLGAVVPDTVAALRDGEGAAAGPDGRYLVTWNDAYYFGSQGFGLVMELEREGIDARVDHTWRVPVTRHRVTTAEEADATVALATGIFVEQWREVPGAVEVAFVEPRDEAEMAEYERLHREVADELRSAGLDDVVPMLDSNLFGASIDQRVGDRAEELMARMLLLGQATAVFVAPPGSSL